MMTILGRNANIKHWDKIFLLEFFKSSINFAREEKKCTNLYLLRNFILCHLQNKANLRSVDKSWIWIFIFC